MTELNIIGGILIIILGAIIIGIKFHKSGKKSITIDEFIDSYGDKIIDILQDAIIVLKIDMSEYESKDEYYATVISTTINTLKENAVEFGIPTEIVDLLDTNSLTKIVTDIFTENKSAAFSILDKQTITDNAKLIDEDVIEALTNETTISES